MVHGKVCEGDSGLPMVDPAATHVHDQLDKTFIYGRTKRAPRKISRTVLPHMPFSVSHGTPPLVEHNKKGPRRPSPRRGTNHPGPLTSLVWAQLFTPGGHALAL